jgi:hypothetical protein
LTIGTIPIARPSTSLVPASLTDLWEKAGVRPNKGLLELECINVHTRNGIVTPYNDGYKVNAAALNNLINNNNLPASFRVVYFQAAKYYFDKGETITINRSNVALSGEGSDKTLFIIEDIDTYIDVEASNFIRVVKANNNSTRAIARVGIACLSIDTRGAFPSYYLHDVGRNGKFKNKSIIEFRDALDSWVRGVRVHRGYGATVMIRGGNNNEVKNCVFHDQWTLGGTGNSGTTNYGGTQGYSVIIHKSNNNLIENNKLSFARHNVVIQGNGSSNNLNPVGSSGNVVAYNYCYDGEARNGINWFPENHPWNITIHGKGANYNNLIEGNICEDEIAVDDEHGSNGINNTFYRNLSKTTIGVEINGSNCFNAGQRFLGNIAYKRTWRNRFNIDGNNHLIKGNKKYDSNGGSPVTGTFDVGDDCQRGNNYNTFLSSGQTLGQSCYLTLATTFINNLPTINIPAKYFDDAPALACHTCTNVPLPESIWMGSDNQTGEETPREDPSTTVLSEVENANIQAYPNPASNNITIQINAPSVSSNVVFQLFDVSGKLVAASEVQIDANNSFEYDLSTVNAGIYIGALLDNGKRYTVKIVKQ